MESDISANFAPQAPDARRRLPPSSTNLPLVEEGTADPAVRALLSRYRQRFQRSEPAGIVLCFATNAALLQGMLEIAEGFLFSESLLSRRHKEMIATFLSQQNACPYCAGSHAVLLEAQCGSPELVSALQIGDLNARHLTHAESALLAFSAKVNTSSSSVTRSDVEGAMQAGWTEAQVAEAVHVSALFAAFNRIANGFGLPAPFSCDL